MSPGPASTWSRRDLVRRHLVAASPGPGVTWSGVTLVRRHLVRRRPGPARTGRDDDDDDDERRSPLAGCAASGSRPSQRIMLLTAAVAAAAVALFVIVVRSLPGAPTALTLPWVLWAAAFAVERGARRPRPVEAGRAQLLHRRPRAGRRPVPGDARPTSCPPRWWAPAPPCSCTAGSAGLKLAFNVAQYGLGGCLARSSSPLLAGTRRDLGLAGRPGRRPGRDPDRRPLHLRRHQPSEGRADAGASCWRCSRCRCRSPSARPRSASSWPARRSTTPRRWRCSRCRPC